MTSLVSLIIKIFYFDDNRLKYNKIIIIAIEVDCNRYNICCYGHNALETRTNKEIVIYATKTVNGDLGSRFLENEIAIYSSYVI